MTPRLRRRYSVRARSETRDARGERSTVYTHKFYVWGEIPRGRTTDHTSEIGGIRTEDTVRLRARYHVDIEVGDQFLYGTDELYVRQVDDVDGGMQWLQIVLAQSPAPGT